MLQQLIMKYSQVCKTTLDQVVHCIYTASNMNGQNSLYGILTLLLVKDVLSSSASDSKKSTKSSMIDAFLLAWFTHLTTKILADLQYHLFGPDAMMEIFEAKINKLENGNEMKNGNTEDASEANNHKEDKPKKKDHLRRRTRRLFISDSEGSDLSENDSDDDFDNDDDSDTEDDDDDEESELVSSETDSECEDDLLIEDSETLISVKTMMVLIRDHPMLESFQVCCQWLKANSKIVHEAIAVGEKSTILWTRLAMLLTKTDAKNYEQDLEDIKPQLNCAFPEDKIGRGMSLFASREKLLNFDSEKHLSKDEVVRTTFFLFVLFFFFFKKKNCTFLLRPPIQATSTKSRFCDI